MLKLPPALLEADLDSESEDIVELALEEQRRQEKMAALAEQAREAARAMAEAFVVPPAVKQGIACIAGRGLTQREGKQKGRQTPT